MRRWSPASRPTASVMASPPRAFTLTFNEPVTALVFRLVAGGGSTTLANPSGRVGDLGGRSTGNAARDACAQLARRVARRSPGERRGRVLDRRAECRADPRHREHGRARCCGPVVGGEGCALSRSLCRHRRSLLRRVDRTARNSDRRAARSRRRSHSEWSPRRSRSDCRGSTRWGCPVAGLGQKIAWTAGLETSYGLTAIAAAFALFAAFFSMEARRCGSRVPSSLLGLLGVGVGAGAQRPCQRGRAAVAHAPRGLRACGEPRILDRRAASARRRPPAR